MDSKLVQALNNQYNFERLSSALYYALSLKVDEKNLVGMASWMRKQAVEEQSHADKISSYLIDRNQSVFVGELPASNPVVSGELMAIGKEVFEAALEHEHKVTARMQALHEISSEVKDEATCIFLQWFISEQVEEEKTLDEILTKFDLGMGNGAVIMLLDNELGQR